MSARETPVTTQVSRFVPAEKAARFEELLRDLIAVAGFDGHLGSTCCVRTAAASTRSSSDTAGRPSTRRGSIPRSAASSPRIDELLDDPVGGEVRSVDGWEGWFVGPGYAPPAPPRRWKMAAITLAALYPIVLILVRTLRPLSEDWPLEVGLLLTIGLSVTLMNWIVMPALTRRLGSWLRR